MEAAVVMRLRPRFKVRSSNWENAPGHGANLKVHRGPANSGINFSANDVSEFNWTTNGSGNFNNPIYSNEAQCLADQTMKVIILVAEDLRAGMICLRCARLQITKRQNFLCFQGQ